jgi:hypothetical protein
MSEHPVGDLSEVGDDSSDTASSDNSSAQDAGVKGGGTDGPTPGGGGDDRSQRDKALMPDLADSDDAGTGESNPN